jgi:hypothetical protein
MSQGTHYKRLGSCSGHIPDAKTSQHVSFILSEDAPGVAGKPKFTTFLVI